MTAGPIKGRNWHTPFTNPQYQIILAAAGTGAVKLQGTNTVALDGQNLTEMDILPTQGASWSDIDTATETTSVTGTFSTEYEYLRLIVSTQGTGMVVTSWVRWS